MLLLMLVLVQPAVPGGPDRGKPGLITPEEIPYGKSSAINATALAPWQLTPEPVTVFHAEAGNPAFPGPKHMTAGPNVIEVSLQPVVLSLLIVLAASGIAVLCIRRIAEMDTEKG